MLLNKNKIHISYYYIRRVIASPLILYLHVLLQHVDIEHRAFHCCFDSPLFLHLFILYFCYPNYPVSIFVSSSFFIYLFSVFVTQIWDWFVRAKQRQYKLDSPLLLILFLFLCLLPSSSVYSMFLLTKRILFFSND